MTSFDAGTWYGDENQGMKMHQFAYLTLRRLIGQYHMGCSPDDRLDLSVPPRGGYALVEQESGVMAAILRENAASQAPRQNLTDNEVASRLMDAVTDRYNQEQDDVEIEDNLF